MVDFAAAELADQRKGGRRLDFERHIVHRAQPPPLSPDRMRCSHGRDTSNECETPTASSVFGSAMGVQPADAASHLPPSTPAVVPRSGRTRADSVDETGSPVDGVPGLFGAYRAGNVTLANAVGTGVCDDKAVYPFVEDMIRFYLSEEPLLNKVPTTSRTGRRICAYVLDHLPELVVKAVNESGGYGMLMGPSSTAKERSEFHAKIRNNPRNYIAQPMVTLSTCPTWTEEGLAPRHVDLRPYIVSGKTQLGAAGRPDAHRPGEGVAGGQLQPGRRQQGHLGDGERQMISRVAEHCFWMSRYLERAENTARILEVNQTLLLDLEAPMDQQWRPLLIISGVHDMAGEPDGETVQNHMTWETDNLGSVVSSLAAARENARIIREVISADMWERMNYYHLWMQGRSGAQPVRQQPQRVLQPDQAHQPADPRHRRRHDGARRSVGVLSARQVPRTGLPDGPHSGCEISHSLAHAAAGRHAGGQRPLGRHPGQLLRI